MIIDCIPFFNELDLLEMRYRELNDVVDVFFISEATLTFTGKPKPLYFNENKERFKEFEHKIHHIIIDNYDGIKTTDPRSMDRNQKQRGIDAMLKKFDPVDDDVVIMTDADEIPRAEKIKEAIQEDWDAAMIEMGLYYYWLNCRCGGRAGSWRNPRLIRPNGGKIHYNSARKGKSDKNYWDAGWHFGFLYDIQQKIDSWTHAPEYNKPPYNTKEHILDCITNGKDLFNRKRYEFKFLTDLSYLPKYVLDNIEQFEKFIYYAGGKQ